MWAQRSRVAWLGEGDNNTRCFHIKANARNKINTISELLDSEGRSYSSAAEIENVVTSYFRGLFASTQSMTEEELRASLESIPTLLSNDHNRLLIDPYLECEVKSALFQLYPYKLPGLDGFPAGFSKNSGAQSEGTSQRLASQS
ncbi:hypothetical protein QQ045_012984 [Rhodiola kirilowii]